MSEFWRRFAVSLGVRVVAGTLIAVLWAWSATLRKQTGQLGKLDRYVTEDHQVLAVFWHGKYLPLFPLAKGRQAVVITVDSFRGKVIAAISRRFGYRPVLLPAETRISGFPALVQQVGENAGLIALALDGPSGPYHRIRSGALQLGALHGVMLAPVGVASSRKIVLSSRWDRQEAPLPFSRVVIAVGDMIDLSPIGDRRDADLEETVRRGMDAVEREAETILRGTAK